MKLTSTCDACGTKRWKWQLIQSRMAKRYGEEGILQRICRNRRTCITRQIAARDTY